MVNETGCHPYDYAVIMIMLCYPRIHLDSRPTPESLLPGFMKRVTTAAAKSLQSCPTLSDPMD